MPLRPDRRPPIDRDALLTHCAGSPEFAHSLLSDFAGDLPKRLEQIAGHVREGDAQAAAEAAHSLKGSAGILAATAVREIAAEIEAAGKAGDLARLASLADRLGGEVRRCQDFIPQIQETMTFSKEARDAYATT